MLEQCAQRVAKGRDALLPAYCTLCEVIHARTGQSRGGGGGGGFQLFRRGSRGRAAAGYARLQEIGDVRLNCQRRRWLETA